MARPFDPNARVSELWDRYAAADADVVDLLCDSRPEGAIAYTVVEHDLTSTVLTYGDLRERSERFASALAALGVTPGDRVATLMGKSVEYLTALLAIWRLGAVHVPLFTAFAPPAIAMRLEASRSRVVVCDSEQHHKLDSGGDEDRIVIVAGNGSSPSSLSFSDLVRNGETGHPSVAVGGDGPLIHVFTSGTTGQPKGVVAPVKALASFHAYAEFGLGLTGEGVYWCAADPGWAYGLYFGILGSFTTGVPSILLHSGFDTDLTWSVLARHRVTNFAAAPTVYRALRASERSADITLALRRASSAGEPLTPEVNQWAAHALGVEVHDHYGQTEAGMLINNHHHESLRRSLRTGSMGHAMPGWRLAVLREDSDEPAQTGEPGRIAADLTASRLAWFDGYEGDQERSAEKFSADRRWYLTGDVGHVDEDGYFYFAARDDDVIIMSGYRIGPFEVESALVSHPAVQECAAIAVPDGLRGEVLEAFVVLGAGTPASDTLARELQQIVKDRFAAHAYPRVVHFVSELPKTPSGKIQRYVLRRQRVDELSAAKP